MNPLTNMFGQKQSQQNNLFDQFSQFAANFQGDPKQKVMELLQSGKMTQEQFERLSSMARLFQNRR